MKSVDTELIWESYKKVNIKEATGFWADSALDFVYDVLAKYFPSPDMDDNAIDDAYIGAGKEIGEVLLRDDGSDRDVVYDDMLTAVRDGVRGYNSQSGMDVDSSAILDQINGDYGSGHGGFDEDEENMSDSINTIMYQVACGDLDIYDVMNYPKDGAQKEASEIFMKMYHDIAIERGLHEDDDFEQIFDVMVDEIEREFGQGGSYPQGFDDGSPEVMNSVKLEY
jgi:hypothetical protein